MRFGISATSWIFPKNLRTRLRPVNVCAISSLALSNRRARSTLQNAATHRDHQDRRRTLSIRFGLLPNRASLLPSGADMDDSGKRHPKSPIFVSATAELLGLA